MYPVVFKFVNVVKVINILEEIHMSDNTRDPNQKRPGQGQDRQDQQKRPNQNPNQNPNQGGFGGGSQKDKEWDKKK